MVTADTERLSSNLLASLARRLIGAGKVFDMKHIADLFPITIDSDRLSDYCSYREPRDPPLVFYTELSRAVDAALAKRFSIATVYTRVIYRILIAYSFRATVWRVKIEWELRVATQPAEIFVAPCRDRLSSKITVHPLFRK